MLDENSFKNIDRVSIFGGEGIVVRANNDSLYIHIDDGELSIKNQTSPLVSKMDR